jgi:hypothetical protein
MTVFNSIYNVQIGTLEEIGLAGKTLRGGELHCKGCNLFMGYFCDDSLAFDRSDLNGTYLVYKASCRKSEFELSSRTHFTTGLKLDMD